MPRNFRQSTCEQCKKQFMSREKNRKYCSQKCMGIAYSNKRPPVKRNCLICNKEFYVQPNVVKRKTGKYCSKKCCDISAIGSARHAGFKHSEESKKLISKNRKGKLTKEKNFSWNGGEIKRLGYIYARMPEHPLCSPSGYVAKHRLIMEKHLGRYLDKKEIVHHINGDKGDNRIENLLLFASNAEHIVHHNKYRKYRPTGSGKSGK